MASTFRSIPMMYWLTPGLTHEEQTALEAARTKRILAERSVLKRCKNKPISARVYRKLLRSNPSYFYELPFHWQADQACFRYYMKRALNIKISRKEGSYAALLAFMQEEDIGFTGSTLSILSAHGERLYAFNADMLASILLKDCARAGADTSSLEFLGRWHIQMCREAANPKPKALGAGLSSIKARASFLEHQVRMGYLFRYYSLSVFESSIVELGEWAHFLNHYGESAVAEFPAGRRFLLERDMGL